MALPVDVTQVLIELPLLRVRGNTLIEERDCFVCVNVGQDHCAIVIRVEEFRIEGRRRLQQGWQQVKIERRKVA